MLADMARTLVIKATSGTDAPERCSQAFTVAATALAAGVSVSLWLTGESAWFALPGRAGSAGGQVTLCTQCAARRGISAEDVIPGVRIAGAAVFVEEAVSEGAQALVY